jgi:hypothetical protein
MLRKFMVPLEYTISWSKLNRIMMKKSEEPSHRKSEKLKKLDQH